MTANLLCNGTATPLVLGARHITAGRGERSSPPTQLDLIAPETFNRLLYIRHLERVPHEREIYRSVFYLWSSPPATHLSPT
jgi:hypothetical protein